MIPILKIRLKRIGAKKRPKYRIVVAESSVRRDGVPVQEIGYYDPQKEPVELRVNAEAAAKWLSHGAQPTPTAKSLLKRAGVFDAPAAAAPAAAEA